MSTGSILVTGANGFVGASIVRALSRKGREVVALVRAGREGAPQNHVTWRAIRSWDRDGLSRALEGARVVVHAASVVHKPGAEMGEYERFNRDGTRDLMHACAMHGVAKCVFLSTIKVYGEDTPGTIDETTPVAAEGGYAQTKIEAEEIVKSATTEKMSTTIFRLCPVYGPGDKGNVRRIIGAIAKRRFFIPGDGSTRKSLVHVSTVADVVAAAAEGDAPGTYVVADRETPSIRELANQIALSLGRSMPRSVPAPLLFGAGSAVERVWSFAGRSPPVTRELIRKSLSPTVCSPAKVERTLKVRCHVDLARSIDEEIAWLRAEGQLAG